MSEVRITIGRREYAVACAEGEESHVVGLGETIDAKLAQLGGNLAPNDSQNLLFGALFVADELHELRAGHSALERAQAESATALETAQNAAGEASAQLADLAARLAALEAERDAAKAAQASLASECEELRGALEEARSGQQDAAGAYQDMEGELDLLRKEAVRFSDMLGVISAERDRLGAQLEEAQAARQSVFAAAGDDPDLAPALERFADLLEDCAMKLETKAAST